MTKMPEHGTDRGTALDRTWQSPWWEFQMTRRRTWWWSGCNLPPPEPSTWLETEHQHAPHTHHPSNRHTASSQLSLLSSVRWQNEHQLSWVVVHGNGECGALAGSLGGSVVQPDQLGPKVSSRMLPSAVLHSSKLCRISRAKALS